MSYTLSSISKLIELILQLFSTWAAPIANSEEVLGIFLKGKGRGNANSGCSIRNSGSTLSPPVAYHILGSAWHILCISTCHVLSAIINSLELSVNSQKNFLTVFHIASAQYWLKFQHGKFIVKLSL